MVFDNHITNNTPTVEKPTESPTASVSDGGTNIEQRTQQQQVRNSMVSVAQACGRTSSRSKEVTGKFIRLLEESRIDQAKTMLASDAIISYPVNVGKRKARKHSKQPQQEEVQLGHTIEEMHKASKALSFSNLSRGVHEYQVFRAAQTACFWRAEYFIEVYELTVDYEISAIFLRKPPAAMFNWRVSRPTSRALRRTWSFDSAETSGDILELKERIQLAFGLSS